MKNISLSLLLLIIVACGTDKNNMQVQGKIKGLKKGTIYLIKANDSAYVSVDSTQVNKDATFSLSTEIEHPEAFYITLDNSVNKDNMITFFGYNGLTTIETSLKNFGYDVKINGSKEQELLDTYVATMSKFQNQNLELIKQSFEAKKANDTSTFNKINKQIKNQEKRKYLFITNFALNHKNSIVSPYIALTEINDANINLLDTINKSLTKDVKASKYGKALDDYIKNIKE